MSDAIYVRIGACVRIPCVTAVVSPPRSAQAPRPLEWSETPRCTARALLFAGALLGAVCFSQHAAAAKVWVLEIDGAIGPASADYFIRSLEDAEDADVDLVVLRLDTPGGLDKSMRDMIKVLLASPCARGHLRLPERRPRGERRHVHHVRQSRRGDGSGDQHRFVHPRSASAAGVRCLSRRRRGPPKSRPPRNPLRRGKSPARHPLPSPVRRWSAKWSTTRWRTSAASPSSAAGTSNGRNRPSATPPTCRRAMPSTRTSSTWWSKISTNCSRRSTARPSTWRAAR